jgi:hypothetical protein
VKLCTAHLGFEAGAFGGCDEGIVGTDADQHAPAIGLGVVLRRGRGKAAVEADHGLQIGAGARELERHGPAEAEPDRRGLLYRDLFPLPQRLQGGEAARPHPLGIGIERLQEAERLTEIRDIAAVAMDIAGQSHIAQLRQPFGTVARMVAEPEGFGEDQDAGPRLGAGFDVKRALEAQAVGFISQGLGPHVFFLQSIN